MKTMCSSFNRLCVMVLLGFALMQSGCALLLVGAAATGTGVSVAYFHGALNASLEAEPQDIAQASQRVLENMMIDVAECKYDMVSGVVKGVTAEDTDITITITRDTDHISKISIRVGVFGNESLSRNLLDRIKKQVAVGA